MFSFKRLCQITFLFAATLPQTACKDRTSEVSTTAPELDPLPQKRDLTQIHYFTGTFGVPYQGQDLEFTYKIDFSEADLEPIAERDAEGRFLSLRSPYDGKEPVLKDDFFKNLKVYWETTLSDAKGTNAKSDPRALISLRTSGTDTSDSMSFEHEDISLYLYQSFEKHSEKFVMRAVVQKYFKREFSTGHDPEIVMKEKPEAPLEGATEK